MNQIKNEILNCIKKLLENFNKKPTFFFSKTERTISYQEFPAEDLEKLNEALLDETLLYLITQELQTTKSLFLYHCPDNALIQFEDPLTDEEILADLFYEVTLTTPGYKLYLGDD